MPTQQRITLFALAIVIVTTLASCTSDNDQLFPTPIEFARWQIGGHVFSSNFNSTFSNGYLMSACDDNHKMYVAINGTLDTSIHKIPVMAWGSTLPPNAVAFDFAQGVGTDYLSIGGDSVYVNVNRDEGSRMFGRTEITFLSRQVHLVMATSSGPTTSMDSVTNCFIYLP